MVNLLLIDSIIPSREILENGINDNTKHVEYNLNDSFESLNQKINDLSLNSIENVAFVFVNNDEPVKIFVNNNSFISFDNTGILQNNTTQFIKSLVDKFQVKKLDFLACNLLQVQKWKEFFDYLTKENEGLTVRASNNRTGNLIAGGDWILESTNEDVRDLYFNENLDNWNNLLDNGQSCAVVGSDGALYTCGDSNYTAQGRPFSYFQDILNITDISAIACGTSHTMILKADGSVWGCGNNGNGQIGSGTTIGGNTFIQAKDSTNANILSVKAIACGFSHTIVLKNDGSVWATGFNNHGQIGDNTIVDKINFVQVMDSNSSLITNGIAIAGGSYHTSIIRDDNTVWSCGYNSNGQLGNNISGADSLVFVKAQDSTLGFITDAYSVACGYTHTAIIRSSNKNIWVSGNNSSGQFGDNTNTNSNVFVQSLNMSNVSMIACCNDKTLAITDGQLWGTGSNSFGDIGINTSSATNIFVQARTATGNLINVSKVYCGNYNTTVVKSDGTVWTCGMNYGQLGNLDNVNTQSKVYVQGKDSSGFITNIASAVTGNGHTVVLKNTGTLLGCGSNNAGQIGLNNSCYTYGKAQIENNFLSNVVSVGCGESSISVVKNDGTVWGCGNNGQGQLGDGTSTNRTYFVQSKDLSNVLMSNVVSVTSSSSTYALKKNGTVWATGQNGQGQLGNNTSTNSIKFVQCMDSSGFLNNIVSISCGTYHVAVVKSDGTVWTCGYNNYGQLGIDSTTSSSIFVQAKTSTDFLTGAISVSCGPWHTVVLKSDGTVWGCGYNSNGNLGVGNLTAQYNVFTQSVISNVIAISCGQCTIALKRNGTVWTTGPNYYGGLAGGNTNDATGTFIQGTASNGTITDAIAVNCTLATCRIIRSDGTLWACGYNGGRYGNNTTANSNVYISITLPVLPKTGNVVKTPTTYGFTGLSLNSSIAYFPNALVTDLSANEVTSSSTNFNGVLSGSNRKVISLLPSGTTFSNYINFDVTVPSQTTPSVYFKSGSDSVPVKLSTTDSSGYGSYYQVISSTSIKVYTNHFSEVAIGQDGSGTVVAGGAGGDPHITTFDGETYDLPNIKGKFLLFDNLKQGENKLRITCDCDFLNSDELNLAGKFRKLVKDATFIKCIYIEANNNKLEVDMNTLTIKNGHNPAITIGRIYEDKYVFANNYNNLKTFIYNINFDGKSRNINIKLNDCEYNVKLSVDLNCADHRTEVFMNGPDLNSGYGALVSSKHKALLN